MFENLTDIEMSALEEFDRFGINHWTFSWNNRKTRTLGEAFFISKKIELSTKFVLANWNNPRRIRDVILHEIAHALAYEHRGHAGHGEDWIYYCNIVGAKPNVYQDGLVSAYKTKIKKVGNQIKLII